MKRSARLLICLGAMTVGALAGWLLRSSRAATTPVISSPDKTGAAAASTAARQSQAQSAGEEFAAHSLLARMVENRRGDSTLFEVLLTEWMKRDPSALIAALSDTSGRPGVNHLWLEQQRAFVVTQLLKTDPVAALAQMAAWGISRHRPDLRPLEKWIDDKPGARLHACHQYWVRAIALTSPRCGSSSHPTRHAG